MAPLVSIVTPSCERATFLERCWRCVRAQTYANIEWLVLDDSAQPNVFLQNLSATNVRYTHAESRLSIGAKRNWLIERAQGEIILHFDDDDYYAPDYARTMAGFLEERKADIANLCGWFVLDSRSDFFGYWDMMQKTGPIYHCAPTGTQLLMATEDNNASLREAHLGFGFTYAFRKAVWQAAPFPDASKNEDGMFMKKAMERFKMASFKDTQGLCLHTIHDGNMSGCFAQSRLPSATLKRLFPGYRPAS